eukprot:2763661-Rhodomonas_salina.1
MILTPRQRCPLERLSLLLDCPPEQPPPPPTQWHPPPPSSTSWTPPLSPHAHPYTASSSLSLESDPVSFFPSSSLFCAHPGAAPVSYTHLRAHETEADL